MSTPLIPHVQPESGDPDNREHPADREFRLYRTCLESGRYQEAGKHHKQLLRCGYSVLQRKPGPGRNGQSS